MPNSQTLSPAQKLASANQAHFPNESAEYRVARNVLLAEEIELRRHIERVAAQRRALPPGGKLVEDFELVSEAGPTHLSALFGDKETLMVYSMMFGPQRLSKIEAFKKRMGWHFPWVSSFGSDFNFDYHVSATKEEMAKGEMYYNYRVFKSGGEEQPGISVFYKDKSDNDRIYHTYSSYARGGDLLIGTYNYLDLTPKSRNEINPDHVDWVRHHDRYDDGDSTSRESLSPAVVFNPKLSHGF